MKIARIHTIDIELAKRLQEEDNASALINKLLMSHYQDLRPEEEIIAEVKSKIIENKKKDKEQVRQDKSTAKLKKTIEESMK